MTTIMTTPRKPFAELSDRRLQHLTSNKNRQNGLLSSPINAKSPLSTMTKASPSPISNSSKKRSYSPTPSSDSENIDPSIYMSPSKKSKGVLGSSMPMMPSHMSFAAKPSAAPSSLLRQSLSTPRASVFSSARTPFTAPAGRSPPRKKLTPTRRISAPYTRIDPPTSRSDDGGIPFLSLEEALAGTKKNTAAAAAAAAAAAIPAPLPSLKPTTLLPSSKPSLFSIWEDTPEQEAENLMEHSTTLLDLSSDDDDDDRDGQKKTQDRGKENVAPEGMQQAVASGRREGQKQKQKQVPRRRRVEAVEDAMSDDHQQQQRGERSPLSEVEREDFFPAGVRGDEVVVVGAEGVVSVEEVERTMTKKMKSKKDVVVKEAEEDIVIFEDAE